MYACTTHGGSKTVAGKLFKARRVVSTGVHIRAGGSYNSLGVWRTRTNEAEASDRLFIRLCALSSYVTNKMGFTPSDAVAIYRPSYHYVIHNYRAVRH